MATKYLMQAATDDPDDDAISWTSVLPDWTAAHAPALGGGRAYVIDSIAIAGGGIDNGSSIPDKTMTFLDGSYVVFADGSYAVTS